jgi:hydroxymethylbilane synthase
MTRIRIATRKSRLALWQSEHVAEALRRRHPGLEVSLVPLSTRGDEILDRSLAEIGGKGLFLKELERALLADEADIAVHSLKDVPAHPDEAFELVAYFPREDWRDWWITCDGRRPEQMPPGSRVGTASLRRQSQILAWRPELEVVTVRGNVQTRLAKLDGGEVDALILAAAGLKRLAIDRPHVMPLEPPRFLPSAGQGVIVVQCRAGDRVTRDLLEPLDCKETVKTMQAERAVVAELGGDCRMPLAALAQLDGDRVDLRTRIASPDGTEILDAAASGPACDARAVGVRAARSLLEQGAARIIASL